MTDEWQKTDQTFMLSFLGTQFWNTILKHDKLLVPFYRLVNFFAGNVHPSSTDTIDEKNYLNF